MYQRLLFVVGLSSIILLAGCGKKVTSTPIQFEGYTMQWYTNDKIYQQTHTPVSSPMSIIYQATQQVTGLANSLLVGKVTVSSGAAVEEIVELNAQEIQQKLLSYQGTDPKLAKVTCDDTRLTGYYFSFSYDLSEDQHFSAFQYFFQTGNVLYMISLESKDAKDISPMIKSIKTIACK